MNLGVTQIRPMQCRYATAGPVSSSSHGGLLALRLYFVLPLGAKRNGGVVSDAADQAISSRFGDSRDHVARDVMSVCMLPSSRSLCSPAQIRAAQQDSFLRGPAEEPRKLNCRVPSFLEIKGCRVQTNNDGAAPLTRSGPSHPLRLSRSTACQLFSASGRDAPSVNLV